MAVELFATKSCPYCAELRGKLDADDVDYVEYDVETDAAARERLWELVGRTAMVPVLVDEGRVTQVGVEGRGCYVSTS
jgi:glutaredoxin 3